jgi:hypothetical protein
MEISYLQTNGSANDLLTCTATDPTAINSAADITTCSATGYLAYKAAAGNFTAYCRWCTGKNSNGTGHLVAIGGATACDAAGTIVTDCSFTDPFEASGTKCYECDAGKTMNNARAACAAMTSNIHCGKKDSTDAWCAQCRDGYYFNLKYCVRGNFTTPAQTTNANLNCMATWPNDGKCLSCRNDG